MLEILLWMALAASGGVLSGVIYDKATTPATATPATAPTVFGIKNSDGSINFMAALKLVGILAAGALIIHFVLKIFKIKLLNKVR